MQSEFTIITAIDSLSMIGIREYDHYTLPWPNLKNDMLFFKNITTSSPNSQNINAIIMGMNTWKSLPEYYKKNSKRYNIILSKNQILQSENYCTAPDFETALNVAGNLPNLHKIFVIGGANVYDTALRHSKLSTMIITQIQHKYPNFNEIQEKIFFPISIIGIKNLVQKKYLEIMYQTHHHDVNTNIDYEIVEYQVNSNFREIYPYYLQLASTCFRIIPNPIYLDLDNEFQYTKLILEIMNHGVTKKCRNDITKSIFGYQLKYDLSQGFPISTVKKCYPKSIFSELMWIIKGETDVNILRKQGVHIWDKNSSREYLESQGLSYRAGDIGAGYGFQMRYYGAKYQDCETDYKNQGVDQLMNCIKLIREDPFSRRIIINLWNPEDINKMALPPCHFVYQFTVDPSSHGKSKLNCHIIQRSWDVLLGWNTTTAALLTHLLANHCDLDVGILVHSITDAHIYQSHIDSGAVQEILNRKPRKFPNLKINCRRDNIEDYIYDDITLENYYPCPPIKMNMIA